MNSVPVPRGLILSAALLAAVPAAFAQAPANDAFAAAEAVTAGTVKVGSIVNATAEATEPPTHWTLTYTAPNATGRSVWYSYTPLTSGLASFSVVSQGASTNAVALQAAAYSGTALNNLIRIASANSTAGTATTAGAAFPSNLFPVTAGTPVFIQVTGAVATATIATATPFDLKVTPFARNGTVVLPRYSNWEWLHTIDGVNPTAAANWATTWKVAGDATDYGTAPAVLKFSAPQPAPLGFAALDGAPGIKSAIGTAASGVNNNAAYARTTFTLAAPTSNLWAEVVADDGAYIYIDDNPGVPVNIAAALTAASTAAAPAFLDYRPQPDAFLSGTLATGCRAYAPAGFNPERGTKMIFLGALTGTLNAGAHRVAVSLHQTVNTSTDMAFDMQLLDMGAYPLSAGTAGVSFNDVPYVAPAANAVLATEYSAAPAAGQTDLAWFCVSPAASPRQATVIPDTTATPQKALRFHATTNQRFVTEPVFVEGLPQFVASLRILTHDSTAGFEADDGFRVFLETSTDGITWAEPAPPIDIQPQVNGVAALDLAKDAWLTKSTTVSPNNFKYVRTVITGGNDSTNEYMFFDDVRYGSAQIFAVASAPVFDNKGNDDRLDDTVTFNLTVTGAGNATPTWTTSGFGAGNEVSGTIGGPAVSVTRPATNASGVTQNVVFTVAEDGDPATFANVTVVPPATAIGTITLTNPVRNPGADPNSTADDTITFSILVDGTATGVGYQIRSSDTGNTELYGNGTYGIAGTLTLPAGVVSLTIKDNSLPTLLKAATLPPAGTSIAMGRTVLNGTSRVLYNNPTATASVSKWRQGTGLEAGNPAPADLEVTPSDTLTLFNPAAATTPADVGVMESTIVDVTGLTGIIVSATLRAWEDSTTTGFETTDTFKIEVIEERAGGETTVNLITGNPADDTPANGTLNGYSGVTGDTYDSGPTRDEFNTGGDLVATHSRGTFNFAYSVPADVLRVRVKVTAANDSANEFFYLHSLLVSNAPPGNVDSDGDGQSDASELVAGTDPQNPASVMRISAGQLTGNQISLSFDSVIGKKYIAQTSTDLANWTDTGVQVTATGTSTSIANLPITSGHDFYRVRVVP